jgi:Uma2 family endonuclease
MSEALVERKRYTLEEYFALEERSEEKHEYHNGKLKIMAGGTIPHNKIAVNIARSLDNWIEENNLPYVVLGSDTKIRIEKYNRNVYPDVLVVCEKVQYWEGRNDIIVNPLLIFEVISESTEGYDRSNKFDLYRTLPSFKEYVLISQFKPLADDYFRQTEDENLWKITTTADMEAALRLHSIGFDLPLAKIYWQVPELLGEAWEG